MKNFLLVIASAFTLALGGCADESLITDEEYQARRGPAPFSPDPMSHISTQVDPNTGRPRTY